MLISANWRVPPRGTSCLGTRCNTPHADSGKTASGTSAGHLPFYQSNLSSCSLRSSGIWLSTKEYSQPKSILDIYDISEMQVFASPRSVGYCNGSEKPPPDVSLKWLQCTCRRAE
jgi:hypothetical protein